MQYLYLHGFASGPHSRKARFFQGKLSKLGIHLDVPDLAPDFHHLSLSAQLAIVDAARNQHPATLIGSSMGGYLAALYAARHPELARLILLAPAFDFYQLFRSQQGPANFDRWEQSGVLPVYHYAMGRETTLGFQLMQDAQKYEPFPDVKQPCLVIHGRQDTVVPAASSHQFAHMHAATTELILMDSDHELINVLDEIWKLCQKFLFPQAPNS